MLIAVDDWRSRRRSSSQQHRLGRPRSSPQMRRTAARRKRRRALARRSYPARAAERAHLLDRIGQGLALGLEVPASRVVLGAHVASTIVRVAEDEGADLIAMSTHGRGGLRRLVLGSVATDACSARPYPSCWSVHNLRSQTANVRAITSR